MLKLILYYLIKSPHSKYLLMQMTLKEWNLITAMGNPTVLEDVDDAQIYKSIRLKLKVSFNRKFMTWTGFC